MFGNVYKINISFIFVQLTFEQNMLEKVSRLWYKIANLWRKIRNISNPKLFVCNVSIVDVN
jgi:hypothetical protein